MQVISVKNVYCVDKLSLPHVVHKNDLTYVTLCSNPSA